MTFQGKHPLSQNDELMYWQDALTLGGRDNTIVAALQSQFHPVDDR